MGNLHGDWLIAGCAGSTSAKRPGLTSGLRILQVKGAPIIILKHGSIFFALPVARFDIQCDGQGVDPTSASEGVRISLVTGPDL